jgi:hypothetical protein
MKKGPVLFKFLNLGHTSSFDCVYTPLTIFIIRLETLHLTFATWTFTFVAWSISHSQTKCYVVKTHGRQRPYCQGAQEGNIKGHREIWGSSKIGAFLSFILYFSPLFSAHLGLLIASWVLAQFKVRTLSFGDFTNNFIEYMLCKGGLA